MTRRINYANGTSIYVSLAVEVIQAPLAVVSGNAAKQTTSCTQQEANSISLKFKLCAATSARDSLRHATFFKDAVDAACSAYSYSSPGDAEPILAIFAHSCKYK